MGLCELLEHALRGLHAPVAAPGCRRGLNWVA